MQVFRPERKWGEDNTEYASKHNHARHRCARVYFSDFGPLNSEPTTRAGTAPGITRAQASHTQRVKALTPSHGNQKARKGNRQLRHPNSFQTGSHDPNAFARTLTKSEATQSMGSLGQSRSYQGTLRYKGQSVRYLRYDEDKWSRPGYWPNCRERKERWDNYRLNQWEDNRYESCSSPKARKKLGKTIPQSNRMPFQATPYSEQSPTMLFYQQKLRMSKSMPLLSTPLQRTHQESRIFDFANTQQILTNDYVNGGDEEGAAAEHEHEPAAQEEELPTTARKEAPAQLAIN